MSSFYKAKRTASVEEAAEQDVAPVTEKLGAFKFSGPLQPLPSYAPAPIAIKFQFAAKSPIQFNIAAPQAGSSEDQQKVIRQPDLKEERKFIVNKDLFTNPFINPMKRLPLNSTIADTATEAKKDPIAVPQRNLNSDDEVKVKSLFDFKQNAKFLKTDDEGGKVPVPVTKSFQFNVKTAENDSNRGLTVAPVFNSSNPFKIPSAPPVF